MSDLTKSSPDLINREFTQGYIEKFPNMSNINIKNFYYYRPNETKQLDADYTREQIKNLSVTCDNVKNISELEKLTPTDFINWHIFLIV
jgi:hypothetical protein